MWSERAARRRGRAWRPVLDRGQRGRRTTPRDGGQSVCRPPRRRARRRRRPAAPHRAADARARRRAGRAGARPPPRGGACSREPACDPRRATLPERGAAGAASTTGTPSSGASSTCSFGDTRIQADQLDIYQMDEAGRHHRPAGGGRGQRRVHARRGAAVRREARHGPRHRPGHLRERARLRLAGRARGGEEDRARRRQHLPDRGRQVHLLHAAEPALELHAPAPPP